MQTWTPDDWVSDPAFLSRITDPALRDFARDVHSRWKVLGRQFNQSSSCNECFSSFILPFPFIVPGGRFREAYYWVRALPAMRARNCLTACARAGHLLDH